VNPAGEWGATANSLASGKLHVAVMPGIEYAWMNARDPKVQALIVATNKDHELRAMLVTKKDSPLTGFADLKGKNVNLILGKEHCRLFADKNAGGKAQDFFAKLTTIRSGESALDDILLGKVQAAIVDNTVMDSYKEINPGRYEKLKVIEKSEQFPEPV